ncbi:hypothetical protein L6R52_10490 [Myxococcota bacterium]|nr:hypothetical protein [Myxococcota bacterium]
MRARLASIALLTISCGEGLIDPSQRATLVLDERWSTDHHQLWANVAESWNLEMGTQLDVGPERNDTQPVSVTFSAGACRRPDNGPILGRAEPDGRVDICDDILGEPEALYEVARHELGHVLGIVKHTPSVTNSVMSTSRVFPHSFRLVDHRRFLEVNPGWEGAGGCDVVRRPAAREHRAGSADLVMPIGSWPHMIWRMSDGFEFAPLSADGQPIGVREYLPTREPPTHVRAHSAPDGFSAVWRLTDGFYFARVKLAIDARRVAQRLDLPLEDTRSISVAHLRQASWLVAEAGSAVSLHVLDSETGEMGPPRRIERATGRAVSRGDEAFLVTAERDGASTTMYVAQLSASGLSVGKSDGTPLVTWPRRVELRGIAIADAGILVVLRSSEGALLVGRIDLGGPTPELTQLVELREPGLVDDDEVGIVESPFGVHVVSLMTNASHRVPEVYLGDLHRESLAPARPWQRLSAPDGLTATTPRIAVAPGYLLTVWNEADGDVRSRCVPLDH